MYAIKIGTIWSCYRPDLTIESWFLKCLFEVDSSSSEIDAQVADLENMIGSFKEKKVAARNDMAQAGIASYIDIELNDIRIVFFMY